MMPYLTKPRKVPQVPTVSPSKFHLPFSYDRKFKKQESILLIFFLLKCKCQTEHIIYDTTVNDVCLRQNKFCHFPGQWCLQEIKGRYLEAMTRAVGAGPSSRVECRWMKRKGLRKQSSQVTRMNSLLSFNKITDELMSSLKSGKPDISRILFWAPRILCFRFCLRH